MAYSNKKTSICETCLKIFKDATKLQRHMPLSQGHVSLYCSMQQTVQVFIVACNKVPKFALQHAKKVIIACKKVYIISFIIVVVTSMFSVCCQYAWINMSFRFYFRQKYFQALLTRLNHDIRRKYVQTSFHLQQILITVIIKVKYVVK